MKRYLNAVRSFLSLILAFSLVLSMEVKAEIRVMALNTEWLWTPYDGKVDGSKFNKGDMSKKAYLEELAFYRKIVVDNNIDLLAVSEIENQYVAKDMARKFGSEWRSVFVQGRDTATGQDLAFISRLKLVEGSVTHFGFPCGKSTDSKKRKCLSKVIGARYHLPSHHLSKASEVGVLSAHFLSKRNDSKSKSRKRLNQAIALSKAADALISDLPGVQATRLIVLGDFNDHYQSKVIKALRKNANLNGSLDCDARSDKDNKRRLRQIDHVLFRGFECIEEYAVSTGKYSDHDAVVAVLR